MTAVRTASAVDDLAERYLDEAAALDPAFASHIGLAGYDDALPELSPSWHEQVSELRRRTLAELDAAEPVDSTDRVTIAALRDVLEVAEQLRATGAEEADLNNIASPVQTIRDVFDLMPTRTADDWAHHRHPARRGARLARRLHRVAARRGRPRAGRRPSPGERGHPPVRRQRAARTGSSPASCAVPRRPSAGVRPRRSRPRRRAGRRRVRGARRLPERRAARRRRATPTGRP